MAGPACIFCALHLGDLQGCGVCEKLEGPTPAQGIHVSTGLCLRQPQAPSLLAGSTALREALDPDQAGGTPALPSGGAG